MTHNSDLNANSFGKVAEVSREANPFEQAIINMLGHMSVDALEKANMSMPSFCCTVAIGIGQLMATHDGNFSDQDFEDALSIFSKLIRANYYNFLAYRAQQEKDVNDRTN